MKYMHCFMIEHVNYYDFARDVYTLSEFVETGKKVMEEKMSVAFL